MTINPGLAVFTAVSSVALVFGNSAHAGGPDFLGYPPSSMAVTQTSLAVANNTPSEIPAIVPSDTSLVKKKKLKLKNPKPIASSPKLATTSGFVVTSPTQATRGSSAGNTYAWGYCTWYAKSMRPDLPNNLGNGGQWVARAASQGFAVGSKPRAGAIGEQPGHVVYVKSVNKNGTVNVSEMNYNGGVGVVSHRTVPASMFTYIY